MTRRIVPTLIQRQDTAAPFPEPGSQFRAANDRAAFPLFEDAVGAQEPGRRLRVDLLADATVDLHALIRKSLQGLAKPAQDAAGAAAASALPKPQDTVSGGRQQGYGRELLRLIAVAAYCCTLCHSGF